MRKRNKEVMPDGAEIIETDELLLTERSLSDVTANSRIGAFVGASGTGKTFSVREIVDDMDDVEVVWLEFESRPTILHLARVIYLGLFDDKPPANRNAISNAIILGLEGRPATKAASRSRRSAAAEHRMHRIPPVSP
ncbi:MAG: hypothetical protein IPK93_10380 [Solirubrobacterales bacterium]|nr:hypothetical protein [Solirubrobacterales bacterium]